MTTILTLRPDADVARVRAALTGLGLWTTLSHDPERPEAARALLVDPSSRRVPGWVLQDVPGVADVLTDDAGTPRLAAQANRAVEVPIPGLPAVRIGGQAPAVLIAGPCAVESEAQIHAAAAQVARAGARLLRGGAFKPRTSPYSFAGHGPDALAWMRAAATAQGLGVVTEVLSEADVDTVASSADLLQVGSRTMASFGLLHAIGRAAKPVLLKRGRAATLDEWRKAAEHLLNAGAAGVIFCERGILGHDPETRNTLDLAGAAILRHADGLPVIVDPSHGTGRRDLIAPMARAALAMGAHGLIIESHPDAAAALSDGPQALSPAELERTGQLFQRSPQAQAAP